MPKGVKGADVIRKVKNKFSFECGIIKGTIISNTYAAVIIS